MFDRFRVALAPAITAIALALVAPPVSAQQVGAVATVTGTVYAISPDGDRRRLRSGSALMANETIESRENGRAQILFLDQSSLSMGPDTTLVLDTFVYSGGSGQMNLRLTEGALRFIGGALSRQQPATVTTPTATIGVRGSSVLVLSIDGRTVSLFVAGERLCATVGGETTCTSRAGGLLGDQGYGGAVSADFVAYMLSLVDGTPQMGTSGGTAVTGFRPPRSGALSTGGEEFDPNLFEDEVIYEAILDYLDIRDTRGATPGLETDDDGDFIPDPTPVPVPGPAPTPTPPGGGGGRGSR